MKIRSPWRHPLMAPFYLAAVIAFAMPARAYSAVYVAPNATVDVVDAAKKVVSVVAGGVVRVIRWIEGW